MYRIKTIDYALMAEAVYNVDSNKSHAVGGYECNSRFWQIGWGGTNTNFKACAYKSMRSKEVVVAFEGTELNKLGDIVADVQILLGTLTQYSNAAYRFLTQLKEIYGDHEFSLVGHSLGGALAQVMGHWAGLPFVTFNAPGMWAHLQRAKVLGCWKSIRGTAHGKLLSKQAACTGRNFRHSLDPVSLFGSHYGPVTRFWSLAHSSNLWYHGMSDMVVAICASEWAAKQPFNSKNKEWGELD